LADALVLDVSSATLVVLAIVDLERVAAAFATSRVHAPGVPSGGNDATGDTPE
jgi:hypothetical protein